MIIGDSEKGRKKRLGDAGKSHKLIMFGIHFESVGIFTAEFEFDMGRIDGAVSGIILSNSKINCGG
jgi:hypothetical protein